MKNKILKFSLIAAVAVASIYTAYSQSQESEALSDLTIENVEALASSREGGPVICLDFFSPCENGLMGPYMQYY